MKMPLRLNDRAVLCVGGRNGNVASYRELIEREGAQFAHHDGGLEDNANRLEASLAAAGPWPWPRERIASMIELLIADGARGVALWRALATAACDCADALSSAARLVMPSSASCIAVSTTRR